MSRKTIPKAIKRELWEKYFGDTYGKCQVCGKKISPFDFDVGHKQPHSKGGSDEIGNLVPLCGLCNSSMGTMEYNKYMKQYHNNASYKFNKHSSDESSSDESASGCSSDECEYSKCKKTKKRSSDDSDSECSSDDDCKHPTCKKFLNNMIVPKLRQLCVLLHLHSSGVKDEVIDRILDSGASYQKITKLIDTDKCFYMKCKCHDKHVYYTSSETSAKKIKCKMCGEYCEYKQYDNKFLQ